VEGVDRQMALGREALARHDWREAKEAFGAALEQEETPEALEGVGGAAIWLQEVDVVFDSFERAYRLYLERDDQLGAGRAATWVANAVYSFRRDMAVTAGWCERAEHLLADAGPTPELAWLIGFRAHVALLGDHDPEEAWRRVEQAAALAEETSDPALAMLVSALKGLLMVTEGRRADGMRLLDEASAAAAGGEITNALALENVCCYQIYACKRVRDFDRAAQWCLRLEEIARLWASAATFAVCRTHYADVLIWQGRWEEAERELKLAVAAFGQSRPAAADAYVRLAELRRRQGRVEEAEMLLRDADHHPLAALSRGAAALDRGDPERAADFAERYLRRIGDRERSERVAGLELLVRARLARGDGEGAERALDELSAIADILDSDPLNAAAAVGTGLAQSAASDHEAARRSFEDAVDLYERSGAPYEAACARLDLARELAALGRHESAREEGQEAARKLRQLGASGAADGVAATADGLTSRELEVLRLLAQGRSNQQIAADLVLSVRTVERHISNVYAKIGASGRSARAAAASYAARLGSPS
jgi:ATP/maltotriose-dependent transcriptional regulator MalT